MEKIEYQEFWDIPRLFIVRYKNKFFLFNCKFDEEKDDYPDTYKVYLLKESDVDSKNWEEKISSDTPFLGELKTGDIRFDTTKRKEMDVDILNKFI